MAHRPPVSMADTRQLLRQLSHQSSDSHESVASEELELLKNVYFEELEILQSESDLTELKFHITPSTGDDKERQYVYLDLVLTLPAAYPLSLPQLALQQSRGLSDAHLRGISEGLAHKCRDLVGFPMVYELIEYAKDCLTDNNRPCGQCVLCQFDFQDDEDFSKTGCYHYFHTSCLVRYIHFYQQQQLEREEEEREEGLGRGNPMGGSKHRDLECPVCREAIPQDDAGLGSLNRLLAAGQREELFEFTPSEPLRRWQAEMARLLQQQREKGGAIDHTEKDAVIDVTWVSRRAPDPPQSGEKQLERRVVKEHVRELRHRPSQGTEQPQETRASTGSLEDWIRDVAQEQNVGPYSRPAYSGMKLRCHQHRDSGNGEQVEEHNSHERRKKYERYGPKPSEHGTRPPGYGTRPPGHRREDRKPNKQYGDWNRKRDGYRRGLDERHGEREGEQYGDWNRKRDGYRRGGRDERHGEREGGQLQGYTRGQETQQREQENGEEQRHQEEAGDRPGGRGSPGEELVGCKQRSREQQSVLSEEALGQSAAVREGGRQSNLHMAGQRQRREDGGRRGRGRGGEARQGRDGGRQRGRGRGRGGSRDYRGGGQGAKQRGALGEAQA